MNRDELLLAALDWASIGEVCRQKVRELEEHGAPRELVAHAKFIAGNAVSLCERLNELAAAAFGRD